MRPNLLRHLLVLLAIPLAAHDLYFLPPNFRPTAGKKIQIAFHNGDAFPESEVNAPIARLRDLNAISSSGARPITGLRAVGKEVLGEAEFPGAGDILLTARTSPNFIQLEPDKFEEYLKEEGLDHVLEFRAQHAQSKLPGKERYSKYVKSLLLSGSPNGFYNHVAGLTIEIVPESNPSLLKPGERLPVRVLFRGKPAAGLAVESAFAPPSGKTKVTIVGRTDKDGRISIPIEAQGRWRIHTLKMEPCAEPKVADWESFWASLTFENQ